MYIPFNELPNHARVWIYQADKNLSADLVQQIQEKAQQFISQWTAHGNGLKASAALFYDRFLVISVDENHTSASGCSIDASVRFVKSVEEELGIGFFDRTNIPFMIGNQVETKPMAQIKSLIENQEISAQTLTFNNLVSTVGELKTNWQAPAVSTWLARYF